MDGLIAAHSREASGADGARADTVSLIERLSGVPVLYGSSSSTTWAWRVTDEMLDAVSSGFAAALEEPNSGGETAFVFPLCFQTAIFRVCELLA
jgi:hypothetical protein